jgi:polysaccharide pyruvyl transferase WcaK-like protein
MIIGLHGSYFVRNFGDTLLLNIIYNWIKEACPNSEVILPYITSHKEAVEILNNTDTDSYKKYRVSQCNKFVFGGGGYFGEPNTNWLQRQRWSYRNYGRHIGWNKELYTNDIPFSLIGIGVGPLSNYFLRKKALQLFEKANFICVRDNESLAYLRNWESLNPNIYETADLALTVRRAPSAPNEKKVLGIHFPILADFPMDKIPGILSFLKTITEKYTIKLVNDQEGQMDIEKKSNITRFIKDNNIEYKQIEYHDPSTLINELNSLDAIITTKLHVGILGYALKKPVLSIPNHAKNFRFYKQIDRSKFCIPSHEADYKRLLTAFDECIHTEVIHNAALMEKAEFAKKKLLSFLKLP